MGEKATALNINGANSRDVAKEVFNSCYGLTKEGNGKDVPSELVKIYLQMTPDHFTAQNLAKMISQLASSENGNNTKVRKARNNTFDRMTIPKNYFYEGQEEIQTTLGRFIFNKFVLQGSNIIHEIKYINYPIKKGDLGDLDQLVGNLYLNDAIDRKQFNSYIDRRDTLAYWVNGMLAHTISQRMLKPLPEINKKKAELIKKYEKEIKDGNIVVMNQIENELLAYAREVLKDDPGMELYDSGDLDFNNNYKCNNIIKGPVMNKITNKFDFIASSFADGIEIKDIPSYANGVLDSQYPASIALRRGGYMGKQLLALLQMMRIDEPGTDCGTKKLIPLTITKFNKKLVIYSYIQEGEELVLLDRKNIDSYIGKTVMMRSPMTCISHDKICNKCAGELFNKLGITNAGLFSVAATHTLLNKFLKSKHNTSVVLYKLDPTTLLQPV